MNSPDRRQPHWLIQVYALAVCFSSLVCLMIALGVGLYDGVQIANPGFTLPAGYEVYWSNESFVRMSPNRKEWAEAEVTRARRAALADALAAERRAAEQSGVFVLIVLTIDVVVFAVHWRLARRFT